jgi:hypothetical protein
MMNCHYLVPKESDEGTELAIDKTAATFYMTKRKSEVNEENYQSPKLRRQRGKVDSNVQYFCGNHVVHPSNHSKANCLIQIFLIVGSSSLGHGHWKKIPLSTNSFICVINQLGVTNLLHFFNLPGAPGGG